MILFKIILFSLLTVVMLAMLLNPKLPRWFCRVLGWHLSPNKIGFDGCSATGTCPRCGKDVLQDSQGNWF